MARKKRSRRKKALYEIIGGTSSKDSFGKTLEQLQHDKTETGEAGSAWTPTKLTSWPTRPRMAQFTAGRIEVSVPYQLGIAVLLGVILLFLIIFRLGQVSYRGREKTPEPVAETLENAMIPAKQTTADQQQVFRPAKSSMPASAYAEPVEQPESTGSNRIVIQTYRIRTHLEPVKQYFAANGVATEIKEIGGIYYLVTSRKYQNPERPGTDGFDAKQRIIELGAGYKAPQGYETFGRKPFYDAYGMRFDD